MGQVLFRCAKFEIFLHVSVVFVAAFHSMIARLLIADGVTNLQAKALPMRADILWGNEDAV
jgi:hypothetical protein